MKISKNKLNLMLARRGLALTDLRTEFAPGTLSRISQGRTVCTKTVYRLAKALGCDPAELAETEAV